jgi:hypothetical protein
MHQVEKFQRTFAAIPPVSSRRVAIHGDDRRGHLFSCFSFLTLPFFHSLLGGNFYLLTVPKSALSREIPSCLPALRCSSFLNGGQMPVWTEKHLRAFLGSEYELFCGSRYSTASRPDLCPGCLIGF